MKILNFGSLNIDYVYSVDHFVKKGETISSSDLNIYSGGKGLNQSIALAKAGANVYHAGMIGEDGRFLLDVLSEAGVDTEKIIVSNKIRTGNAIIQKDSEGDNCILLYSGANKCLDKNYIDDVLLNFEKGDYLILQNEINNLSYIIKEAHKKEMTIVLNPSPMDEEITKLPLDYVDYFLINEVEASGLARTSSTDIESLLLTLKSRFPEAGIVLTLGENGSIYTDKYQTLKQPAVKVKVVDTTAAGDTFTGYFIQSLSSSNHVSDALKIAAYASAIAVTRSGASPSIPDRVEVEEMLKKENTNG